ncbi:MAG: T9SS type A sorting domain-containing protein [bacterium]|nr:T9SS type A sorting domain-containing protein [bacterium]
MSFIKYSFLTLVILLVSIAPFVQADEPDPNYWRLDEIQAQFDIWEAEYPDIFHPSVLGQTGNRLEIPMVTICNQEPGSNDDPRMLFHGALHTNEANGTTAIMASLEMLLTGYGVDPKMTARVDSLEVTYVPILNVDSHLYSFSGGVNWFDWRKTMRDNNSNGQPDFPDDGVDLNRNWDWNWDAYENDQPADLKYKGPYPFSEPEIMAVRDWVLRERPVVVVDYHSPVTISWRKYIFWPWMDTAGGGMGPDHNVSDDVAELWAAATIDENGNQYNEIYAYSTLPKEQNWIYANTGILSFIMEISDHCWWSGAMVDTIGTRVARGGNALLDRVVDGPGLRGVVTDASTGEPLVAEVKIDQMHQDTVGPRLTEENHGAYHRLTRSGTYTVTASCDGYESQTQSVSVSNSWETLDFALESPLSSVAPGRDLSWLRTGNSNGDVRLEVPAGLPAATVELFDLRGHRVGVLGENMASGQAYDLQFPNRLAGGVYLVRVRAGQQEQTQRVVFVP